MQVSAELPGLEEKDIEVELEKGVLAIRGEKKTETEDKDRLFSERYYGRLSDVFRWTTSTRTRSARRSRTESSM